MTPPAVQMQSALASPSVTAGTKTMAQHQEPKQQSLPKLTSVLPISVTATSFSALPNNNSNMSLHANVMNSHAAGTRPVVKQLSLVQTTPIKPNRDAADAARRILTSPSELAAPGKGGISLGTHSVEWHASSPSTATTSATPEQQPGVVGMRRGYSAASRATLLGMQENASSTTTFAGKRNSSAPAALVEKGNNHTNNRCSGGSAGEAPTFKYQKVVGGKIPRSISMTNAEEISPQFVLDRMIQARGYSTQNFCSLEGGYYCKPTPLQEASYGIKLIECARTSDADALDRLLGCGLSPNPCNAFGESIVHMVCRRGDQKLLQVLLDKGCSVQVTDDFGRTPLHDACWTAEPNFGIVELILNVDERLLHVVDCRGSSPLSYTKKEHWKQWIEFLQSKVEVYWSPRKVSEQGEEPPPPLALRPPHSKPIPDPPGAVSVETATLLSSGQMDVAEFLKQKTAAVQSDQEAPPHNAQSTGTAAVASSESSSGEANLL